MNVSEAQLKLIEIFKDQGYEIVSCNQKDCVRLKRGHVSKLINKDGSYITAMEFQLNLKNTWELAEI